MKDREVYRRVYLRLWRHPAFRQFTDGEKTLALYLVSGPQTNQIGCYYFSPAMAAEDLGLTLEVLDARMKTVCEPFAWEWRPDARLFFVPSWLTWNHPNSSNARIAWRNEAERVADPMLRVRLLHAIGMPSARRSDGVATQDQDQDQEQKQDHKPPNPPRSRGARISGRDFKKAADHLARIGGHCPHGLDHSHDECVRMIALKRKGAAA